MSVSGDTSSPLQRIRMMDSRGSLWPFSALLIVAGETLHSWARAAWDKPAACRKARVFLPKARISAIRSVVARR